MRRVRHRDPAGEHNITDPLPRTLPGSSSPTDSAHARRRGRRHGGGYQDGSSYDAGVTAAHFEFIEAEIAAAASGVRREKETRDGHRPVADRLAPRPRSRRGGNGRCGERHVRVRVSVRVSVRQHPPTPPSRGGGVTTPTSSLCLARTKKKKAGAGAARRRRRRRRGGGKMPSLDAVLSQLAKKQAEPTFPDVSAWCVGAAQATGSEAIAAASAMALASPPGAAVVVPSRLFAAALTFDLGVLGEDRVVISAARAAKEDVAAWGGKEDAAVVFVSFDPSEDDAAERAARDAAAKAAAAGRPVVAAAVALAPGGVRRGRGTGGAEEARKGARGAPEAKVGTVR